MISKRQLNIIKEYIIEIEKLVRNNSIDALPNVVHNSVKDVINIIFSDIKGKVPNNSPKKQMSLIDIRHNSETGKDEKVILFSLDHTVSNAHDQQKLNTRQDYYDDITDNYKSGTDILIKAEQAVNNLLYIYFDIQGETKHYIYTPEEKYANIEFQLARLSFERTRNTDSEYAILDIRNDFLRGINGNKDRTLCVVTYIPKSKLKDINVINNKALKMPIRTLADGLLVCIKNLLHIVPYNNNELSLFMARQNNKIIKNSIYMGMKNSVSALDVRADRFIMDSRTKEPLIGFLDQNPSAQQLSEASRRVSYFVLVTEDFNADTDTKDKIANLVHDYIYAYFDVKGETQHYLHKCCDSQKVIDDFHKDRGNASKYQILDCHRAVYFDEDEQGNCSQTKPVTILTYMPQDKLNNAVGELTGLI